MITPETLPTRYEAGTASVTAGQTTVTQTGAAWFGNVWGDDLFFLPSQPLVPPQRVAQANEDGTLTLAYPWPGANAANVAYEVRYVGMIERSTAQSRRVLEQLGEVSAYYDVQVNALADRAAFDNRPTGYRVLVSNIGDGRAAVYSKLSGATADWSVAAFFSGPVGPEGPIGPAGITWRGTWDNATTYASRDGVLLNGSSWRAKQASNNQPPPVLPVVENAYWHLVAQKGADGTGTGDVTGPASSTSGRIALFSGATGKVLQEAGLTISDLEPARTKATQAAAETGTGTAVLGWAPQQIAQAIAALAPPPNRAVLGGTANAITLSQKGSLVAGTAVRFRATAASTGAATIAYNGGAAIDCRTITGVALPSGYIRTDVDTVAIYDGSFWLVTREIERGSNVNGEYIRFADGTQVCTYSYATATVSTSAVGAIFHSGGSGGVWNYPAAFTQVHYANMNTKDYILSHVIDVTLINCKTQYWTATGVTGYSAAISCYAIGKWY